MAWKVVSVMSSRIEFISLAMQPDANISELAQRFEISRKTAYKWISRHRAGVSLADQSRVPHQSPSRTSQDIEAVIVLARQQFPDWGARKLHAYLARHQPQVPLPACSTITEILRRNQLLDGPRTGQLRDYIRFERKSPNELWQMDFKGHFLMSNGHCCHPLTVLDDHSRFCIGLVACANEKTQTVQNALTLMFRRYGLPSQMLMDNGSPWGDAGGQPYTLLTVWLMRHGIRVYHGRPYHPQTQGKEERFHRTLKLEVLSRHTMADWEDCTRRFDTWRDIYNHIRPHESLGMNCPVSRYRVSSQAMPESLPELVYPESDIVRKVGYHGRISYQGRVCRLSRALEGQRIGLRPARGSDKMEIRLGHHFIGTFDLKTGQLHRHDEVLPELPRPVSISSHAKG